MALEICLKMINAMLHVLYVIIGINAVLLLILAAIMIIRGIVDWFDEER